MTNSIRSTRDSAQNMKIKRLLLYLVRILAAVNFNCDVAMASALATLEMKILKFSFESWKKIEIARWTSWLHNKTWMPTAIKIIEILCFSILVTDIRDQHMSRGHCRSISAKPVVGWSHWTEHSQTLREINNFILKTIDFLLMISLNLK